MTSPEAERNDERSAAAAPRDFIRARIDRDLEASPRRVVTRFPPEPNGYLHIGHAKSICLNFGLAMEYGGACNLRYDDTNPTKEDVEYVNAIEDDVRWLGFEWAGKHFASDYFERLWWWAEALINDGKAYVDDLDAEQIRLHRGTLAEPGRESPWRDRSPAENLDLFRRMRAGEFEDGSRVLRAKIDMASPNLNLRDPVLYRIRRAHHHRTGDAWCVYPMYDYAHPLSDAIEGVTHSICTLEFEDHRPLYDWLIENCRTDTKPQQIEFARLNLSHTLMSKRKLLLLVQEGLVSGWDDPRMPTLSGLKRRGYTPEAIRTFCERIGVAKRDSVVELQLLEHCLREHLNLTSRRVMAVLRPLPLVIENLPERRVEEIEIPVNPEDPAAGVRRVPMSRHLLIEREDFRRDPPPGYWRLSPGVEVRLRGGHLVRCTGATYDPVSGEPMEVRCTYDPATRDGRPPDGRKVKSTIHWVSADHAVPAEVRLYEPLFSSEHPGNDDSVDWRQEINPRSLEVLTEVRVEAAASGAAAGDRFQFERVGYFAVDPDSAPGRLVFNRTVSLKDAWARIEARRPRG